MEEVPDAQFDASNPQHVAARILGDYKFWINDLAGLDPSWLFFEDDMHDDDFPFGSPDADFEEEHESSGVADVGSNGVDSQHGSVHYPLVGDVLERIMHGMGFDGEGDEEEDFLYDGLDFDDAEDMEEDASPHGGDEWRLEEEEEEEEDVGDAWKIAYSDSSLEGGGDDQQEDQQDMDDQP